MIPSPPPDPELPQLESAFSKEIMLPLLTTALVESDGPQLLDFAPRYVRYKPGTSCLIQFDLVFETEGGQTLSVSAYLKMFTDNRSERRSNSQRLERQVVRARNRVPDIPLRFAAVLPDLRALVQVFPIDYELKSLERASDRRWVSHTVARALGADSIDVVGALDPLRYKPERKALFRYDLVDAQISRLYGKVHDDDRGECLTSWTSSLIRAGVRTPAVVLNVPARRFVVHAEVVGTPLHEMRGVAGHSEWMGPVAEALCGFQDASVTGLPIHKLANEVASIWASARLMKVVMPNLARRLDALVETFSSRMSGIDEQLVTSHGDFYDDQAIVSADGLSLIDLDELRMSHPGIDVGNMLGHLSSGAARCDVISEAREVFREQVLRVRPQLERDLGVFEAGALIKLATGPFRRLEPDWPEGVERIVALAEGCLASHSRRLATAKHPVDPLLPQLSEVLDMQLVEQVVAGATALPIEFSSAELVRHKPGRRAIVRFGVRNGETVFGKTFASHRGPKVYRIAQQIAEAKAFGPMVDLPEPVAYLPNLKLLLQKSVNGSPIDAAMCEGDVELVIRVAQAMTLFHGSKLDLGRSHCLADELKPLTMRTDQVAVRCPHLAEMAWTLHDRLQKLASPGFAWRNRPVHRDFYHDQVLMQGNRLAVLDLDDAAMSEPAVDIANFAAHLRLLGFQRPYSANNLLKVEEVFVVYAKTLDPEIEPGLLQFLMASTFLRLAGIHVDRNEGERVARRLLEAAGTIHRFGNSMVGRSGT